MRPLAAGSAAGVFRAPHPTRGIAPRGIITAAGRISMLASTEVMQRIQHWEDECTEFKREFSTDAVREAVTAFANDYGERGGGVLILGVEPATRRVTGVPGDPEETLRRVSGVCRESVVPTVAPEIYPVRIDDACVIVVEVKRSDRRPHRANNVCYIRVGPTTRKASPDEEFDLVRRSGRFPYDMMPVRPAAVEDVDLTKFERDFLPKRLSAEAMTLGNGRSAAEWAEHLRFLVREGDRLVPTVAAILLFGKRPQAFLPHACVDYMQFQGIDPSFPIATRQEIGGTIDNQIMEATELVKRFMIQGYQFHDRFPRRTQVVEYPWRAVQEAIANAVVHRDYEVSRTPVSIKMFDDRLEILSPGGLYGIVTRENFGTGVNDYRNPTLAVALNVFGLVEKAGVGIFVIRRQMRENGSSDPVFEIGDRYLAVRLPAHPLYVGVRLYEKGLVALERGSQEEAKLLFGKASEIAPHLPEVWAALGRLEALYGTLEVARGHFQRAIAEYPQFEKAYLEWGRAEEQVGEPSKSQEIFRQGTEAVPNSAALWYAWAALEEKTGNRRRGVALYRKAVSLQPDNPKLLAALGRACFRARDYEEAVRWLERAAQLVPAGPERAPILLDLMKALIEQNGKPADIRACFETAYSLGFRAHELFHRYHRFLTSKGLHAEALAVLELARAEAITIRPALPQLFVGNLPTHVPRDRLAGEIRDLLRAQGLEPSDVWVAGNRRFAFVTLPSLADAQTALTKLDKATLVGRRIKLAPKKS